MEVLPIILIVQTVSKKFVLDDIMLEFTIYDAFHSDIFTVLTNF